MPAAETSTDCEAPDVKALLEMHCYGLAKNLISCVPEKGHLPTMSFTLSGSASLIMFPVSEVLSFMAEDEPKVKLPDAVQRLMHLSSEKFQALLTKIKDAKAAIFHGTSGVGDIIYTPPGWVAVISTSSADVIGLKIRCIIPKLTDQMKALNDKLCAHESTSPILASVLQPKVAV